MYKIISWLIAVAIGLCFWYGVCSVASATDISLMWDRNPETPCYNSNGECLLGYTLHNTLDSGNYNRPYPYDSIDIPADTEEVTITVDDWDAEFLFFVLTARGLCIDGFSGIYYECESNYSNEVNILDGEEVEQPPNGGGSSSGGSGGCFINSLTGG